jgi:hypothetical protein
VIAARMVRGWAWAELNYRPQARFRSEGTVSTAARSGAYDPVECKHTRHAESLGRNKRNPSEDEAEPLRSVESLVPVRCEPGVRACAGHEGSEPGAALETTRFESSGISKEPSWVRPNGLRLSGTPRSA